ncbi:MAG: NADH-quinone oxidoreductase subunit NuoG, partial [Chloroflexota bacterium]
MATIFVDGREYEVDGSKNLLDVCLSLGMDLPYFCWHPAMGSVGACRQCAVKQYRGEDDTQGQLVMACMTPAADGTRISLDDEEALEFRESVIEWLMVNHPHDCPICDEGGECHLQDMTVMTGHAYRRFRFKKRTYRNQYLGPFINHEMNRCIQCYRCVRFYRDYADGRDFDVFGIHDRVYFGRQDDGVLENEFSGNLVEVCPTGVFTDKTLKQHYTRKWDLQTAPSVCTLCSVGCNTIPGERYGELRRIRNRYNRQVNGYFICDRGRYGYEFVNGPERIREIQVQAWRAQGEPPDADAALATTQSADSLLDELATSLQSGRALGIGSPRASLEANFALRALVGKENYHSGVSEREQELLETALNILRDGPARTPSLHEIEQAGAILVLGEDLTNTAPMMAYAVRQAARTRPHHEASEVGIALWNDYAIREIVQERKGPVYLATVAATKLEDIASGAYLAAPGDIARLAMAVAGALDADAPAPEDIG